MGHFLFNYHQQFLPQFLGQKTLYVQNTKNLNHFINPDGHHSNTGNIQAAHDEGD